MNLDALRRDLAHLAHQEVLVDGSQATGQAHARLDVDVAVVTRLAHRGHNVRTWKYLFGRAPDRYDIRVFELLPLPVQIEVADHGVALFGDPMELASYFYGFRRLWKDVRHRVADDASVAQMVARRRGAG